jgi:hypothetical protein
MNRTYKEGNLYYTPESFFLAVITAVGPLTAECANFPCSWRQYPYCNNGSNPKTEVKQAIMYGDYTQNFNTAYPIDFNTPPFVGQQVLMRFRMLDQNGNNVYEFIMNGGGGGDPTATLCFGVTSVQCSNNVLQVVSSNASGCLSCTGGLAYYTYGEAFEIPNNTNILLPNRWNLQTGDLADTGLEFDEDKLVNASGQQLSFKITLQLYFTPGSAASQSRWASIVRNGDFNDIPIASFSASNNTFTAVEASNFISLADGEFFQPAAYQNGGAGVFVGGAQRVPSTLLIEKLCL